MFADQMNEIRKPLKRRPKHTHSLYDIRIMSTQMEVCTENAILNIRNSM